MFSKILQKRLTHTSLKRFSSGGLADPNYYMHLEENYLCHNYHPLPVVLKKGSGVHLWDVTDKKYIDCLAGYSAVNQGHCHPKIFQEFVSQASQLTLTSRAFHNSKLGPASEFITKLFKYEKVLFMNSGVEAGESALKISRRWAYEVKGLKDNSAKILFAKGNFWGRTLAACASSDDPERYHRFGPFDGLNFQLIDYGSVHALETALKEDPNVAAFMMEPIQGEKGVVIPHEGYLKEVRRLCSQYNVLFIADEIQTGLGRTGKWLAVDWESTRPDLICLGKALAGGFYPVSAVLCDSKIMNVIRPGDHGSTFGGNPLGTSIVEISLKVLEEEGMIQNSLDLGKVFLNNLKQMKRSFIKDVRGRGLFCAVEMDDRGPGKSAWDLCIKLMDMGLLAKPTQKNTIRFSPPLVVTKEQIEQISNTIDKALTGF
jgi:ornithine--oxo-acid transaminase